ncbi:MAG: NAD-binding protein [Deltaproteobacteria bacterium]|nr:NAD-binding protein [Deltaproteobacteria bacterium]
MHSAGESPARRRQFGLLVLVAVTYVALFYVQLRVFSLDPARAAYEAARCFLLDADPALVVPADPPTYAAVWILRAVAPVWTLGAAAEFIDHLGLFHLPTLFFRLTGWRGGHVVVVGLGRFGVHVARRLREQGHRVVAIERALSSPEVAEARRAGIAVIRGDVAEEAVLREARVVSARALVAVTGDEVANLRAAVTGLRLATRPPGQANLSLPVLRWLVQCGLPRRLSGLGDHLEAWAQVFDLGDLDAVRQVCPESARGQLHLFSSYDWAAAGLIDELAEHPAPEAIAVVGFGRFGQALVRALSASKELAGLSTLIVVDRQLRRFPRGGEPWAHSPRPWRVLPLPMELDDSCLLDSLRRKVRARATLLVVVCTDNDETNLRFALRARGHPQIGRDVSVVTRVYRVPEPGTTQIDFEGVRLVDLARLSQLDAEDRLGGLRGPPRQPTAPPVVTASTIRSARCPP